MLLDLQWISGVRFCVREKSVTIKQAQLVCEPLRMRNLMDTYGSGLQLEVVPKRF